MSRAFVRDDDGGEGVENLPDRLTSGHPNLVTTKGLALIEAEVARLAADYAAAQASQDRSVLQRAARDLRYWTARRAAAVVKECPAKPTQVVFGAKATILRSDGRQQTWRIVGEDEADPSKSTISYVSPLAQALLGKCVGDGVRAGAGMAEIIAIDV